MESPGFPGFGLCRGPGGGGGCKVCLEKFVPKQ